MKLYEITQEMRDLSQMMEGESVDQDSFLAALESLAIERDAKIANIGLLIKELRADIDARKELAQSLQSKNRTAEKQIDWWKSYIEKNLDGPVKTPLISIQKQRGRVALQVAAEAQLPDRFYRKELNKTELKTALEAGEEYYGVTLERGPDVVVIR